MITQHERSVQITDIERRICALVADGLTDASIAGRLGWSKRSLETQLKRLRHKVGADNRAHLVLIAMRAGWIE